MEVVSILERVAQASSLGSSCFAMPLVYVSLPREGESHDSGWLDDRAARLKVRSKNATPNLELR